jgi:hypothetical protein
LSTLGPLDGRIHPTSTPFGDQWVFGRMARDSQQEAKPIFVYNFLSIDRPSFEAKDPSIRQDECTPWA